MTVYYAFKQAESGRRQPERQRGLDGLGDHARWSPCGRLRSHGHVADAKRAEQPDAAIGTNALASSVVLVCRPRPARRAPWQLAGSSSARCSAELPDALKTLQHGNIAPVDLAQASIGPGMAVFSRYSKVMEADGSPMSVRTALALINQALDEILAEQEGEFDADTRWAIAWFEQFGMETGEFGVAETLCKAKNCSCAGMVAGRHP